MPVPEKALADQAFAALDRLAGNVPGPLGVALSGGGDSTALTVIAADWASARGRGIQAASVDHHLRDGSTDEVEAAGCMARKLGLAHRILDWAPKEEVGGPANPPACARAARHRLLGAWAREGGFGAVLLGHTLDDQAETVLMRLMRGSGADGLSAMSGAVKLGGTLWLRPLLGLAREDLRGFLRARGIGWSEDPTNEDTRRDRPRLRREMAALEIAPERLAATAATLARQRRVLERDRNRLAERAVTIGACGELMLDRNAFEAAEEDTRLAVLADAITWIGGRTHRPRFKSLAALWRADAAHTLGGALSLRSGENWLICREPASVSVPAPLGAVWDGRWATEAPRESARKLTCRALGEDGLAVLKRLERERGAGGWNPTRRNDVWVAAPRQVRLAAPSIWRNGALIAVPAAGFYHAAWRGLGPIRVGLRNPPGRFCLCKRV